MLKLLTVLYTQLLACQVLDINLSVFFSAYFRLNAADYGELKSRLQAPLVNARNVVIRQTVTERFAEAFTEVVNENPKYIFNSSQSGFVSLF